MALPGRRSFWIAVWALVPWANAGLNLLLDTGGTSAVWEQRDLLVVLNYAALSVSVAVTLWGSARIARQLGSLGGTPKRVFDGGSTNTSFREVNSVTGPLVLSLVSAVAFGVAAYVRDGWEAAVLRGGTWLIVGVALWTFLWVYGSLQLGLDRLGRRHLRRDAAIVDPTLGLRPLGGVAFIGLWMLLVWFVPVVVTGLPDIVGMAVGGCVLAFTLGTFVFSLWGLHRQMIAVKDEELAAARQLYAEAYAPLRDHATLETLDRQHSLLSAAEALEKRADAIHEWPIDQRTWAWVIGLATSVVAITFGRVVVNTLGL